MLGAAGQLTAGRGGPARSADPGVPGDHRDGRPSGFGRQGGQDGRCGAVARRRGRGRGRVRRGVGGVAGRAGGGVPGACPCRDSVSSSPAQIYRRISPEFPGTRRRYLAFPEAGQRLSASNSRISAPILAHFATHCSGCDYYRPPSCSFPPA
jgi:hypothetical protein